jgi:hypothetical protein
MGHALDQVHDGRLAMTDERIKIFTVAHVPRELGQAWLQHLRDFDAAHPDCHFNVLGDAPNFTTGEMAELLRVHPELPVQEIINHGWLPRWSMPDAPAVHYLHYGLPLCRFTRNLPNEWPVGHTWVGITDANARNDVTCPGCIANVEHVETIPREWETEG